MKVEFQAVPVTAFLKNPTAPVPEQIVAFREQFFSRFLASATAELPAMLYGRKKIQAVEEQEDYDCICFAVPPSKESIAPLLEAMLQDGCEWVLQISEGFRFESTKDGDAVDDTRQECVICMGYAPGWYEMALHDFERISANTLPIPIGDWMILNSSEGFSVGGALVPFSDEKGH